MSKYLIKIQKDYCFFHGGSKCFLCIGMSHGKRSFVVLLFWKFFLGLLITEVNSQVWWYMPMIPATWMAEVGGW
jgi:hypothetical protein